ncbi:MULTISPECIES: prolipoprotein diacylglyceryl transferase [unclassified Candidatus Frackibacter]|uniref:prolipoprotein diacylglyceryl transferase n=1 Tax=unclassified Candidatus Frackibacter TaxID=2648818 RepID=UPI00079A3A7E|nr:MULTISPECIES: prolipoprotein diacylglyceryl transferase [unclassified Candidatus Frackibacter]KXS41237.1 MAG: phosphatidylglycerol:prolipoprotein diacylglycerol transferase [Candidatus Frackibacter sp. T328-2]SDC45116.1 phosphatidylglycerol:prolipoprotein diacylglycerol transferase [Candidatus Frackibacter sp. WG11]SEM65028.1 phosphatidylglycerol:prolipoprotein diacylglycerol transferase [Candidatus Frackibacter sp. WG12]SFL67390.1 phosphatidylglycerol:prolipoprotein diacylglycerol transfera
MLKPDYIDPIAFEIGPISVHWYGIIMASAIFLGLIIALRESEHKNLDPDLFLDLIIFAIPIAIISARAYYVIFQWDYYSQNLKDIIAVWEGGLAIHGALIGATLTTIIFTKVKQINFWKITDIAAPSLILGQAIGRWGNFINQEAYGYKTDLPWAMYIDGAYRHPTFLYESIWDFSVFIFLIWLRKQKFIKNGEVFLSYIIAYSFGRFFVEAFRTDSLMLGPLRMAQVISIVLIIAAGSLIYWRRKQY